MEFYFFFLVIVTIVAMLDITGLSRTTRVHILYVFAFVFTILGAIRFETGSDWEQYYTYFLRNDTWDSFFTDGRVYEYGYIIINYIAKLISDTYAVFLFIFTGIICYLHAKAIKSVTVFPLVALLIWFSYYLGGIFSVRQNVALAVVLVSLIAIIKRQQLIFILLVILATCFHRTALIFLPAYWIFYSTLGWVRILLLSAAAFVIGYTDAIMLLVSQFTDIDIMLLEKFAAYAADPNNNYSYAYSQEERFGATIAKKCFVFILLCLCRNRLAALSPHFKGLVNLSFVAVIITLVFLNIPEIAMRISAYYVVFEVVTLPSLLLLGKNIWQRLLIIVLIIGYCWVKYSYNIFNGEEMYVPFTTVFDVM